MLKKVNKKIENDVVTIEFIYYGNEKIKILIMKRKII